MMRITSKEIEINQLLTSNQSQSVQMHSFLNILNVITMQLSMLNDSFQHDKPFDFLVDRVSKIRELLQQEKDFSEINQQCFELEVLLWNRSETIRGWELPVAVTEELEEADQIFRDIFEVMHRRLTEMKIQFEYPGTWLEFDILEFRNDFFMFFNAMQVSSKGRFGIVHNLAEQNKTDYLIHFEVDSDRGNHILMPMVFKDVIRDLVANARKYTEPGGIIDAGISLKNQALTFIVKDSGIGIPKEELRNVFNYGYRASNVQHLRTMGGGFGLTKALYIVNQFDGNISIESGEMKGTELRIDLPVPELMNGIQRKKAFKVASGP